MKRFFFAVFLVAMVALPNMVIFGRIDAQTSTVKQFFASGEPTEDTGLRTVNSKTYVIGDGTYRTEIYGGAIHYRENNNWYDIDLTLRDVPYWHPLYDRGYRKWVQASNLVFVGKPDISSDDSLLVAVRDENGFWENYYLEIDTTGVAYLDAGTKNYTMIRTPSSSIGVVDGAQVTFENVFPQTDIRYVLQNRGLKEEIVINRDIFTVPPYPIDNTWVVFVNRLDIHGINLSDENIESGRMDFYDALGSLRFFFPAGVATDENGNTTDVKYRLVNIGGVRYLLTGVRYEWLTSDGRAYPVVIDPSIFYSEITDGRLTKNGADWGTVQAATAADSIDNTSGFISVGQQGNGPYPFTLTRAYIYFDTSMLGSSATITEATLSLYSYASSNPDNNFSIVVQNGQPTYPHDPLALGDFYYAYYLDNGGSIDRENLLADNYNHVYLSENVCENWINKVGVTKFCMRDNNDIDNIEPNLAQSATFYSGASSISLARWPMLTITYTSTNTRPNIAENLRVEGQIEPTHLTTTTPRFTALFTDNDANDNAENIEIQVGTGGYGLAERNDMWDSGPIDIATVENGNYCENVTYAGATLSRGVTYYWRCRFRDVDGSSGEWQGENTTFQINSLPTATILMPTTNTTIRLSEGISFQGSYSDFDGDNLTYLWDFGDGTTTTYQNPVYQYGATGIYTVTLIANDGYENSLVDSITLVIEDGGGAGAGVGGGGVGGGGGGSIITSVIDTVIETVNPTKNLLFVSVIWLPNLVWLLMIAGAAWAKKQNGILYSVLMLTGFLLVFGAKI